MTTLLELKNRTFSLLSEPSTSSLYPDETGDFYVTDTINHIVDRICSRYSWSFLESESFFTVVQPTALTAAVATTDVSISVSSTASFPATGKIAIGQDIISYTGKTATTFTGVTQISIAHSAGESVSYVYPLPSDFSRFHAAASQGASSVVWEQVQLVPWYEYAMSPYLKTITLSENHAAILFDGQVGKLLFRYFKTPLVLSADTDECTIPAPHALDIVPLYATGWMMKVKGDNLDGLGDEKIQEAEKLIQAMASKYTHKDSFGAFIKTRYSAFDSYKRGFYQPFR